MTGIEPKLKVRQVAGALGVSVSTIKRWVDSGALAAVRTIGGHRLIRAEEALRFAREHGYSTEGLEALLGEQVSAGRGLGAHELRERLTTALRRGRSNEATGILLASHRARGSVWLADELLRPVLEQIGHEWEMQQLDVFQEHRASRIVESALMEILRGQSPLEKNPRAPLALVAAPEGDLYTISGLLCELNLRDLGWQVMNLGPNLPLRSLARAVQAHQPRITCLTVSHVTDRAGFLKAYREFFRAVQVTGTAVIVGGRALDPALRTEIVAAGFGERQAHLAEFSRRLHPGAVIPGTSTDVGPEGNEGFPRV